MGLRQHFQSVRQAGDVGYRSDRRAFADPADEPCENAAWAKFDELGAIKMIEQIANTLGPTHAAGDLLRESPPDGFGFTDGLCIDIANHRHVWRLDRGIGQNLLKLR